MLKKYISIELVVYDLFLNNYYFRHKEIPIDYINNTRDIIKNLSSELPDVPVHHFISRLLYDNISLSTGRYKFLQSYVNFLKSYCV